jgi:tRNA threonylcarbamoyladenosine biosynthesis protein TsaB
MILCLDTSTPTCHFSMIEADWRYDTNWEAGRGLALGLHEFLEKEIEFQDKTWKDVTGLVVYKGPGSFTGLRIGITVFNTLATTNSWPIVGVTGDEWRQAGVKRIIDGENDEIVLPEYGADAHITKPRK